MPVAVRVLISVGEWLVGTALGGGVPGWVGAWLRGLSRGNFALLQLGAMYSWLFARQKQAWHNGQGAIANAIDQVGATFAEQRIIDRHIIDTIIPKSTQHATGRLYASDIGPLKKRLNGDEATINGMQGTLASDDGWIHDAGRPWVTWLISFYNNAWPEINSVVGIWNRWFDHPGEFGSWAAAPLVGPLIAYLADQNHQQTRDDLLTLLIDASPDRFRHVENAALAILESPYP